MAVMFVVRRPLIAIALVILTFVCADTLRAQVAIGRSLGTVTDASGVYTAPFL